VYPELIGEMGDITSGRVVMGGGWGGEAHIEGEGERFGGCWPRNQEGE